MLNECSVIPFCNLGSGGSHCFGEFDKLLIPWDEPFDNFIQLVGVATAFLVLASFQFRSDANNQLLKKQLLYGKPRFERSILKGADVFIGFRKIEP